MENKFKKENPDKQKRKELVDSLIKNNPGKIPVILEKDASSKLENIQKTRYLFPETFTINEFILQIRKSLKIPEETAIFLAAKGKYNLVGEKTMGEVYKLYKDKEDGFVYIMYSSVLVYG